jgi:2-aminomuconate deaminase
MLERWVIFCFYLVLGQERQIQIQMIVLPGLELDHNGNFISFDFEAQCHSVFQNIKTILEESGSSWEQLVDVTVFLVDMKRDFQTYNKIYAQYFKDNQPCRTTVAIDSLPTPIAIELKCIATI